MAETAVPLKTLDEDAVSFLARMREECPDILSILSTSQVKALGHSPTDPYKGNADELYLTDVGSFHSLKFRDKEAKIDMSSDLLKATAKKDEIVAKAVEKKRDAIKKILDRIKLVIDSRLVATEEKLGETYLPRIVRLCKKYKFTENESRLATYALVCQCGYDRDGKYAYGVDVVSACQSLNIPLSEIFEFFDSDRQHMLHGLFPEVQQSYLLNSALTYDGDYCKILSGSQLKSEEFLKIEQTILADVIAEEPGKEHYRSKGDEGKGQVSTKQTADDDEPPASAKEAANDQLSVSSGEPSDTNVALESPGEEVIPPEEKGGQGDLDLDTILRLEREREQTTTEDAAEENLEDENIEDSDKLKPYKTDLEYLDDHFQLISYKMKVKSMENQIELEKAQYDDGFRMTQRYQRQKREALTKEKVQGKKCEKRLALTKSAGSWIPRLERMVESRNLCEFEKNVLLALIGSVIQPNKFSGASIRISNNCAQVGEMLQLFCSGLEDQIHHRKYFYKSASIVREGMVVVHSSGLTGDTSNATVEVDRRMLDFCVGLDTEFSEIVEGSHLYYPKTKFEQVILPKEQKQLIFNTVSNFEAYKRCRKKMGLDDAITYGAGMVMLFHGSPGTGKTMMANALANKLNKKVLLINFPSLGSMSAGENFKFIFREAKINDAILFFDECEAIFESRESGGHQVNLLLTEIERHDGMIILATNRPYDLDEAMHRRIMIAIEFRQPDHLLRKSIWESHMPEQMKLDDDVALNELAIRFELAGGFIKNAILSALSIAVSRDGDNPVVGQKDLLQGANLQLRGRLRMKDFDRRVIPHAGLDEVIVEENIMKQLKQIVQFEKARAILFGQWGFAKRNHKGLTVLLHGNPGTGKTLVAEAIGYEVGKPLKVVNCGELLSKWVGESTKNIDAIFQEAQHQDAILVFDEAEGLFGQRTETGTSTDRYANIDVGVLLYHIERFSGIVILTTNLIDNIDMAFFRRLRFILPLEIPRQSLRAKLWKLIIPEETPIADDVDFERLAYYEMCGGNIKNVVFRAAATAALRDTDRRVTMADLEESCKEELAKTNTRLGFRRQDSETARIYN